MNLNFFEFIKKFPDEVSCVRFLEQSFWPEGNIVSPFGSRGAYKISALGTYKCRATRKTFTIRHGTVFEDSKLPLQKWFYAIHLLNSLKKGISSVQLAKTLGITQKSAWFMLHRIRYANEAAGSQRPLEGVVEIDEHYSGGSKKGGKRGRGAENKTPVFGLVEREGEVRCMAVPNCKGETLIPLVEKIVAVKHTSLITDDFSVYQALDHKGYERHVINHSAKEYVRDGVIHTNTIEGFWSHLKLGIRAIQIHVSRKHLNRYCKEYEFRYNSRFKTDFERFVFWFSACHCRLTYKALIA